VEQFVHFQQINASKSEKVQKLEALSWSWDLNFEHLSDFASYLTVYELFQGQTLFKERDESGFMVFLISGRIEIKKQSTPNEEVLVARFQEGKVFGEMSLLDGQARSASAVVKDQVIVYLLTKEAFFLMKKEHPRLALSITLKLAKIISCRLRKTTGEWVGLMM
jgi:CRP/FNR family transcriptional regulator, cyclic AMP receptor protein